MVTTVFTTSSTLGGGKWSYSGIDEKGRTITNKVAKGTCYTATNGNVHFVPDKIPNSVTTAKVDSASAYMAGDGQVDGSGGSYQDQVRNVVFRINDIDWGSGDHRNIATVTALDGNGNPATVTITPGTGDRLSRSTITAGNTAETTTSAGGCAPINIAGPVASITIIYSNGLAGTQAIRVSDIQFETMPVVGAGDDVINGGDGINALYGGAGNRSAGSAQPRFRAEAGSPRC